MNGPRTLLAQPLTAQAFAPFGQLIEAGGQARHYTINAGNTERYDGLAEIELDPPGRAIVSIFRGQPRPLPFRIELMERHPLGSQAFVPLSGRRWLLVVAPRGDAPSADRLQAFLARGDQGVNYAAGVWHHPLLALDAASDFLVIDRRGPGPNCDEAALARPAVVRLSD